ncbi:MAG TPA: AraC family transcriptional regulator, partial [Solirubrobacteraceae bacterium]|nr:AraC family transcriptional regulator [Solirubrobacteraceae bacterium]
MAKPKPKRRIVFVLFPGVQSLDVTGPLEVFAAVQRMGDGVAGYELLTLSLDGKPLRTSSGLTIVPDGRLDDAPSSIDTLIVPGGEGTRTAVRDERLLDWIADASSRARRTASVCTGAFLLAATGLLDGRRATTHWASAEALARRRPEVDVDPDPIFIQDGDVWTSAGVTAGMDLALA